MTELSYDSGNCDLQWRCNLYAMTQDKPVLLGLFVGLPVFLAVGLHASIERKLFVVASLVLLEAVFVLLNLGWLAYSRSRGARICSTSISESGVHDVTPDSDKSYPWYQIKDIEIVGRDVFFFLRPFGSIFVPGSAFEDVGEANDFYHEAIELWNAGR